MTIRRVLSIDGGGIKGVFPAAFLSAVEDAFGRPVSDYFDLIVGTSSGGITAVGLGLGLRARAILKFYEDRGPAIFCGSRLSRGLQHLGILKHDSEELEVALEGMFGNRRLGDSRKRLVIPSCNLDTGEVHVWKTSHDLRFERDYKLPAVQVALAAAAGADFPTHGTTGINPVLNGGVWANNPVGIAVVEASGVLKWPKESLRVLSLGCTLRAGGGWLFRRSRLLDVLMTSQSSGSLGIAAHLLGDREHLVRIAPVAGAVAVPDHVKEIPSLKSLGAAEARRVLSRLQPIFFDGPAEPFRPFHTL